MKISLETAEKIIRLLENEVVIKSLKDGGLRVDWKTLFNSFAEGIIVDWKKPLDILKPVEGLEDIADLKRECIGCIGWTTVPMPFFQRLLDIVERLEKRPSITFTPVGYPLQSPTINQPIVPTPWPYDIGDRPNFPYSWTVGNTAQESSPDATGSSVDDCPF